MATPAGISPEIVLKLVADERCDLPVVYRWRRGPGTPRRPCCCSSARAPSPTTCTRPAQTRHQPRGELLTQRHI